MKFSKKIIAALIIVSIVVVAGVTSFVVFILLQESFESKIRRLMAEFKIPSLAAGIVINDSLVWAKGYGDQPDIDTVYMIGSITKPFTATALLQLNESNKIQLDDDINDYLPFKVRNPNYSNTNITIRMLLSHKAGIKSFVSYYYNWAYDNQTIKWMNENLGANIAYWDHRPSLEEFLNESLTPAGQYYSFANWVSEPGTEFLYSNTGFLLLAYLVEQVTNQSMSEYVQDSILDPLNMTSSGYNFTDFAGRNAIPYQWVNNKNLEFPIYNIYNQGSGALRCTVPDLAKFMIAHMNQGDFNGTQLLNPETVELMHQKTSSLTGTAAGGFELDGYGLGWILFTDGLQGHNGAVPGYLANMFLKESEQGAFGAMVMLNRGYIFTGDDALVDNFFSAINKLLLEEAERLFNQ